MAYLFAVAAAGLASATIVFDAVTKKQRQRKKQIKVPAKEPGESAKGRKPEGLATHVRAILIRTDDRYQMFIRDRVDPLLVGRTRDRHLRDLLHGAARTLSAQEKRTNRRFGLGFGALGLLGVIYLTGEPLLPLVILVGIYNLWPWFRQAYISAVEERRLRIIHLLGLYFSVMWLGGFYLVGILGSVFSAICQKIQVITQIGARQDLIDVFGQQPRQVWVEIDGVEVEIPFDQLQIGDLLVLDAGQMVPVDGTVMAGSALLDQHRLTGEAQPVEKAEGDRVLAATVVMAGRLRVRVEKTGTETAAAQIGRILGQTVDYGIDTISAQLARVEHTLWPMLAGGALGWLVAGPVAGAAMLGCNYVVGVVPLSMITLLNALSTGSDHGILVKDGRALQSLKELDTLVFDKTGTLTLEQPQMMRVHTCGERTADEVLRLAATAEHRQTHPIALAILSAAKERGLDVPLIDETQYEVGYGLRVKINGSEILVGSERFMGMEEVSVPLSLQPDIARCHHEGCSLVYVAVDGTLAGALELDAALRPEAKSVLDWLRESGLALYIISGDQEAPTRKLAEELGMDGYFANILPEGKAALIAELQADGRKVGFIGDGINDAIALHQADTSISFRAATNVASDNAQIVLMDDNLEQLQVLFRLARAYHENLAVNYRQAVAMSLVAAAGVLLLPHKFLLVEGLWVIEFASGIRIATRPLLNEQPNEAPAAVSVSARKPSLWDHRNLWFLTRGNWPLFDLFFDRGVIYTDQVPTK